MVTLLAHIACRECGGAGHLEQGHDAIDCPACHGQGTVEVAVSHLVRRALAIVQHEDGLIPE